MTNQRLLTTGFPWHVFPVRCRDVARGITPLFQATPFRVRHWNEPPDSTSLNPGACWLYDDAENGLLVVTDMPVPPKLPDGWMVERVSLDDDWEIFVGRYKIQVLSREATAEGDRYTFEATLHGEGA
jgi:hypothetical protein